MRIPSAYETFSKGHRRITISLLIRPGCSIILSAPAIEVVWWCRQYNITENMRNY